MADWQKPKTPTWSEPSYLFFEVVFSNAEDRTPAGTAFFFRDFGTDGAAAGESCIGRLKRRIPS
jgi:hypothetical protein